jgi:3-oxoacyl-[acyl-carrier protein] reductase
MSILDGFRIDGQIAVVTGGAQGLGFAIAEQFIAEGARVVLGDLNLDATKDAAARLGGADVALAVRCAMREATAKRMAATSR